MYTLSEELPIPGQMATVISSENILRRKYFFIRVHYAAKVFDIFFFFFKFWKVCNYCLIYWSYFFVFDDSLESKHWVGTPDKNDLFFVYTQSVNC